MIYELHNYKEQASWRNLRCFFHKDQSLEEGHEVVPTKTTNWRVLDYKESMVDVGTLVLPEDVVGVEGSFRENVKEGYRKHNMQKYL